MTFPDDAHVCDAAQGKCPMGAELRERVLAVARGELGVREDDGANRDRAGRIAGYLSGCVRDGKRLALGPSPWCAALVSWVVWTAAYPIHWRGDAFDWENARRHGDPSIGYRASVTELCADARATNALRLPADHLMPEVGDVIVFGRGGANPLHGGIGHCGFAVAVGGDWIDVLGGNQDDAVTVKRFAFADALAWIAIEP